MTHEFDVDKTKREFEESEVGQGEKRKAQAFPVMQAREKQGLPPNINRAETMAFVDFLRTGKRIDPRDVRTDDHVDPFTGKKTSDDHEGINMAFESEKSKSKFAKDGFRGKVSMKTLFTVGEGNKKEHVTRKKSKNNNDFDFMGGF